MSIVKRIFIAGHNGMVGSAVLRQLSNLSNVDIVVRTRQELDLTSQQAVQSFFEGEKIDQVYLAAAKVGGIHANNEYPAEFIYQNLMIEANIINAAHTNNVQKLLFLGSSCIYPKEAPQPMTEEALLTGVLECTNEPYAIAKIAGIKLCESYNRQYGRDYRSVMPTNLYGENDNFHPENSHVIPALIRRCHEAKLSNASELFVWGTGSPKREFLYVEDMAEASIFIMNINKKLYEKETQLMLSQINIGSGIDCSIRELMEIVANVVGFKGAIKFDTTKPDGAPRKLMDITRIKRLGWSAETTLKQGIRKTYDWFLANQNSIRK
ncbi:MAG: NAD dependent epimerase/dehydratase family protein [Osedax symbiont Rs2]|nr:MAG: NAD dependent epimerase/dehydratase family protein [Osedax symbiont Rs2]